MISVKVTVITSSFDLKIVSKSFADEDKANAWIDSLDDQGILKDVIGWASL